MTGEKVEARVPVPEGYSVAMEGNSVSIKANGKEAVRRFKSRVISLRQEGKEIVVEGRPASRKVYAVMNTVAGHLKNMINGLKAEYVYRMVVVYSHFPMNVAVKGNIVEINNFVGEKKARSARIVPGATVSAKGKEIMVKSHNKEAAGQTAANIERATRVKGKDKRIYQDGIFITEKAVQETKGGN